MVFERHSLCVSERSAAFTVNEWVLEGGEGSLIHWHVILKLGRNAEKIRD
jgi:hypothetical protein